MVYIMKTTIDLAHHAFFQTNGYILFEEMFTPDQIEAINQEIHAVLAKRGGKEWRTAQELFTLGRDLWRDSPQFNKIVNQRKVAGIASELVDRKPLRLGYDQYLASPLPYPAKISLQQISCIQGVLCGVLISLADAPAANPLFPSKAGDVTYFHSDFELPWDQIVDQAFLLIVYTEERALYILQEGDPHKYALKKLGYAFGDRLKDKLHPIVYR